MWASNLHLPLCLSKRGTRPEFVNSERGNIKAGERVGWGGGMRRKKKKNRERGGGGGGLLEGAATSEPHESPPAHCLVSREMSTFTVS